MEKITYFYDPKVGLYAHFRRVVKDIVPNVTLTGALWVGANFLFDFKSANQDLTLVLANILLWGGVSLGIWAIVEFVITLSSPLMAKRKKDKKASRKGRRTALYVLCAIVLTGVLLAALCSAVIQAFLK